MENYWRLCGTLCVVILNDKSIRIADPEKKNLIKELDKIVSLGEGKKVFIDNRNFSVKIVFDKIYVKHESFGTDEYLLVKNQAGIKDIMYVISETICNKGLLEGDNWSILFNDQKECLPAKDGITVYDKAEIEMFRRLSVSNSSKTSKWIPGYRYDTEQEVFYYLGEVNCLKNGEYSNCTYGTRSDNKYYMTLSAKNYKPKDGETINEAIKNNFKDIKFSTKKCMAVKGKQFATDDFMGMIPLWDDLISNWENTGKINVNEFSDKKTYRNLESLLNIFLWLSDKDSTKNISLSEGSKKIMNQIISNKMSNYLVTYWGSTKCSQFDECPTKTKTLQENVKSLKEILLLDTDFPSVFNPIKFFGDLYNKLGIDIDDIATKLLEMFNDKLLLETWEKYIDNISHVRSNPGDLTDGYIDEFDNYGYSSATKLTDDEKKFFEPILQYCRETSTNSEEYRRCNFGTASRPNYAEIFTINVSTVNRMYDNKVPEDVTKFLMNKKFVKTIFKIKYKGNG